MPASSPPSSAAPERVAPARQWLSGSHTILAFVVVLAAPALALAYLPFTDLPQHYAMASMFGNLDAEKLGYFRHYELALDRSLYLLPYVFGGYLSRVVGIDAAMRSLVFLSLVLYPLGVLLALRVMKKPPLLALLALPLVYNRAVFWGFLSSNLSIGLAFVAIAVFMRREQTRVSTTVLTVLSVAIALCHIYGAAVLLGYAALSVVLGRREQLVRRLLPLTPLVLGALVWVLLGKHAQPYGGVEHPGLWFKLKWLPAWIAGGYQDLTDSGLVVVFLLVFGVLAWRALPVTRARFRALGHDERVVAVFVTINLLLFFALPTHTASVKSLDLRNGVIAFSFLPLLVPAVVSLRRLKLMLLPLAVVTVSNSWFHLVRFDREARSFDRILEHVPERSSLLAMTWEHGGDVSMSLPYPHFSAYAQAKKGAVIAFSFADMAFTMPVRPRGDTKRPPTPVMFEWWPWLYNYERFGYYYEYIVVRGEAPNGYMAALPFRRIFSTGPWALYRAVDSRRAAPR